MIESAKTYNPRTLSRRLIAIGQWHKLQGLPDPTKLPSVTKTMAGIARLHGTPKRQAYAMRMTDLRRIVRYLDEKGGVRATRDKAIMLFGFFGAFRRSELVSLDWEQVSFVNDGLVIKLLRSKTDQTGEGDDCVIPTGREPLCPIRALIHWRKELGEYDGPVFRGVTKTNTIKTTRMAPKSINEIVRAVAKETGILTWDEMSSHSLQRGFATEAARLGASMPAIQRHGRWRSVKMVVEYIEAGRQFGDSVVNVLISR